MTKEKTFRSEMLDRIQYDAENFLERKLDEEELEDVYEEVLEDLIWVIQEALTRVEEKRNKKTKQ